MPNNNSFNEYLLKAVSDIDSKWRLKGYDSAAYTHNLTLGPTSLKATKPPFTMCVAAQMEIIVTAINIYMHDTGDKLPLNFLPTKQWTSLSPGTLKDLIWVNSGSHGTADALDKFGMGNTCKFSELTPGCFINLNRSSGSGHAVLFLNYLDAQGNELKNYDQKSVQGFKYYSSQGRGTSGGFDYRYAFFEGTCPTLPSGKKRDCGVRYSEEQKILNSGHMLSPPYWDSTRRDQALKKIHGSSNEENGLNPIYLDQVTTDD